LVDYINENLAIPHKFVRARLELIERQYDELRDVLGRFRESKGFPKSNMLARHGKEREELLKGE
jgi:hypothetical protein